MDKKFSWWNVPKVLLDAVALVVFGLPAAMASYIWCAISAGWVFGEWSFDPGAFHRRYGGKDKIDAQIKSLRDTWRA